LRQGGSSRLHRRERIETSTSPSPRTWQRRSSRLHRRERIETVGMAA